MDDKDEFDFGHRMIRSGSAGVNVNAKKHVFCLSMCKYELEEGEQSLNMWRQFGLDGHGVGIVFDFKKTHRNKWVNFILSQVYYGEESLHKLYKTYKFYNDFSRKYNFNVTNFDEFLYKFYCFHKQHIYKDEKEVRLIYNTGFKGLDQKKVNDDLNSKFKRTSYFELELEWEKWTTLTGENKKYQEIAKSLYPYVTIDKIIFGYRLTKDAKFNLSETIFSYKEKYNKIPKLENSTILKYFE
jgi:hypothetical protein